MNIKHTVYGDIVETGQKRYYSTHRSQQYEYICHCGNKFWAQKAAIIKRRKNPSCGCKLVETRKNLKPKKGSESPNYGKTPRNAKPKGTLSVGKVGVGKRVMINGQDWKTGNCLRVYSRYVMEQKLGRPLSSKEIVWHIDLDPLNNDISNLEIITRSQNSSRICQVRHHGNYRRELPGVI